VISKVISGGQTGAQRAGLDVAIRHCLPHGGWCPKGRRAEDGPLASHYALHVASGQFYSRHTEWNVRDSDATAIVTIGTELVGDSLRTLQIARKLGKPYVHIARLTSSDAAFLLQVFVVQNRVNVLNIAGSRESEEPGVYDFACSVLEGAFFSSKNIPIRLPDRDRDITI